MSGKIDEGSAGRYRVPPSSRPKGPPVAIENLELVPDRGHVDIVFDVTIEDSWRFADDMPPANWNAAWLYVKYRSLGVESASNEHPQGLARVGRSPAVRPADWQTARLSALRADHAAPACAVIAPSADGVGVFLYRSRGAIGAGRLRCEGVRLRWLVDEDLEFPLEVWVHGVEMVYVPAGSFELGDPGGPEGPAKCFYDQRRAARGAGGASDRPAAGSQALRVESEDELPVVAWNASPPSGQGPVLTWRIDPDDRDAEGGSGRNSWENIPARYPKGHSAFYCMRRQMTQGEFCDFINSLKGDQITARFPYGGQGSYRFTVSKQPGGKRTVSRPMRACNWLSWADGAAWAWWAGLRPMTELEYEKACRGFGPAISGEYAWGTSRFMRVGEICGDEVERAVALGNCNIDNAFGVLHGGDGGQGPVRDDGFGAGADGVEPRTNRRCFTMAGGEVSRDLPPAPSRTREESGASYWGIFGLTGNLWEYVVTATVARGRQFDGQHGTGGLNRVGLPPFARTTWPGTSALGVGYRGGSWYTVAASGQVANRCFAAGFEDYVFRSHDTGMRCVRTAPADPES